LGDDRDIVVVVFYDKIPIYFVNPLSRSSMNYLLCCHSWLLFAGEIEWLKSLGSKQEVVGSKFPIPEPLKVRWVVIELFVNVTFMILSLIQYACVFVNVSVLY